jgi:glucose-1-phosphate cytidylyltransferase
MKVVILAGGAGARLGVQTELKPKPMVEIGGYPILWHILKQIMRITGTGNFRLRSGTEETISSDIS